MDDSEWWKKKPFIIEMKIIIASLLSVKFINLMNEVFP